MVSFHVVVVLLAKFVEFPLVMLCVTAQLHAMPLKFVKPLIVLLHPSTIRLVDHDVKRVALLAALGKRLQIGWLIWFKDLLKMCSNRL